MRKLVVAATAATCLAIPVVAAGSGAGAEGTQAEGTQEFVVLYAEGVSTTDAQAAIAAAGGTIVSENADVVNCLNRSLLQPDPVSPLMTMRAA